MASLTNQSYTVGWICALPSEMAAARAMLDEDHGRPREQDPSDRNNYRLGRIWEHNVVLACLPAGMYGSNSAATVAAQMLFTFRSIRFGLMVGVGGGVPREGTDIRLGDVVVSKPEETSGGVRQYDFGKTVGEGRFTFMGSLNRPPQVLLTAVSSLEADHMMEESKISKFLAEMVVKYPNMGPEFSYPGSQYDQLYEAEYDHAGDDNTCQYCDSRRLKDRPARSRGIPTIHHGLIASGNQVMKHGVTRDRLRNQLNVLCFEMEAAGLMDNFPCLVIRGICDYADSHKNERWQKYAAATAAAYAKELLYIIPTNEVTGTPTATQATALSLNDLRFQSDPVLKILLAQFEETIRNDDSNQTQPRSTSYLNFFLSLSDSHLLNVVEQGAVPIDRPDADGNFLLHGVVAQQRAVPTVRRILEAGADPAQIDESGITSVHIALNLERKDIAWVLLKTWKMRRGFADGTGAA